MTLTDRPPSPPVPPPRSLRPLLIRLHFYAGLFAAPFILVAAVSGLAYAATPQLEQAIYHHELTTPSRGTPLPLDRQIAAARTVEPHLPLYAVRPAPETGGTTRVEFDTGHTADSSSLAVFVDPVTGHTRGELNVYGTSGTLPLRTWIDTFHRTLHLGSFGRIYSEMAASWLWVIGVAGVVLWWSGSRRRRRLRPERRGGPRQRTLSWHGAVGTWLFVGMLALSATGLTWSQYAGAHVTDLRSALHWSTPQIGSDLDTGAPSGDHAGHTGQAAVTMPEMPNMTNMPNMSAGVGHASTTAATDSPGVGFQWAWQAARARGLTAATEITPPGPAGRAYTVTEVQRGWPEHVDAAAVDPASGDVTDVVRFADYPFMAKMARWGVDLHMGLLFGIWNQIALILLALGLIAMIGWGYRMWWLRRPHAPRWDGWGSLPRGPLAVVTVVALAVGWFLPVFGLSLLAFLLVDLVVGAKPGRTPPPAPAGSVPSPHRDRPDSARRPQGTDAPG